MPYDAHAIYQNNPKHLPYPALSYPYTCLVFGIPTASTELSSRPAERRRPRESGHRFLFTKLVAEPTAVRHLAAISLQRLLRSVSSLHELFEELFQAWRCTRTLNTEKQLSWIDVVKHHPNLFSAGFGARTR